MDNRTICWFSAGAASAVAAKLTLSTRDNVEIIYIDTHSEHPDNRRFLEDCEQWFGQKIKILSSEKYTDIYDVFDKTGYLVGPAGARCTTELKKKVRTAYEHPSDEHVFGYTSEEKSRAGRFENQNPGLTVYWPLIEHNLTKLDTLALVDRAGIALPAMYKLGYKNNNCIGCVKGGMGYWNKIRVDFPEIFEKMASQERKMGRTVLRENVDGKSRAIFLDELDPERGNYHLEDDWECGISCALVEEIISDDCQNRQWVAEGKWILQIQTNYGVANG